MTKKPQKQKEKTKNTTKRASCVHRIICSAFRERILGKFRYECSSKIRARIRTTTSGCLRDKMGNAQSSSSAQEAAEEEERENSTTSSGRREGEEVVVEMSSASPRSQSAGEEEKNEEAKRKEDEEKEEDNGEEETEDENRIVASCRVCLEPIRKSDVMIENNSACLLGCKCSQVGIHLNRECGIKYLKNLQRPNQTLTLCEVCQSPMSEFATKIQQVLNATTSTRSSPFALHDSDGFLHTFSRPRRRPAELCEFFCFLVPCLPCVALAYTNCFHSTCVSLMRFRAYIFLGLILALLIIFLSDVYLTMEDKYESRVREQRKDINNNRPSRYPSNDDDFNNNNFNGGMNYNPNAYDYYSRGRG
jgi:hypothetical protein